MAAAPGLHGIASEYCVKPKGMTHCFALRPLRLPSAGLFAAGVAAIALLGCRAVAPAASPSSAESDARAADADRLPPFDVEGDAAPPVSARGVPYERYYVSLGDAPTRGPADAPVTIVMFSDFECPYCARGLETMNALLERYPQDVRVAYKAYPLDFHENAFLAAMAARSAQSQGKFWAFHDRLYTVDSLDRTTLETLAGESGLDRSRLQQDLESLQYGQEVLRDLRQGRNLGVSSTPSFFVNGRLVKGAQPVEEIAVLVEQELALAKKWREQGVRSGDIYQHAISDGYRRVEYTERAGLDSDQTYVVPVGDSPSKGPADALVTIVEFGDFECPFCVRGNHVLNQLEKRYGDELRIVYKHFPLPFHSHAFLAARASMAAHAQGKFWPYHDALYRREAQIDSGDFVEIAKLLGLDMKAFERSMSDTKLDAAIVADQALAAAVGVQGTPAYFINGRAIEGARPEWQFRLIIDEELVRARNLVDDGLPPSKVYDTVIRQPFQPSP